MILSFVQLTPLVLMGIAAASLLCLTVAVSLVLRELFGATDGAGSLKVGGLRRPFNVTDELPSGSLTGRLDQGFERLVLESGVATSPLAAFFWLLFLGLAVGGALFIWRDQPLAGIAGVLLGMMIGLGWMIQRRSVRYRLMRETLPDVLDLMSRAVRAGESLDQAITLIGDETTGPLGQEFQLCSRQLEMGMSISAVMKSLMRRVRLPEVRILATTLMVHRQTGGNLALTLERMSGVIRDRLNYVRQMKASTGAGRISAFLIALAGPIMFLLMFTLQYDHLKIMFEQPLGQSLLAAAIVLELIGVVWVLNLLKTD